MAKTSEVTYEVIKENGEIGGNKKVRIMSWNGNEAKLDIRPYIEKDGEERCGKGICLTNEEGRNLVDVLTKYFKEVDDEEDDF